MALRSARSAALCGVLSPAAPCARPRQPGARPRAIDRSAPAWQRCLSASVARRADEGQRPALFRLEPSGSSPKNPPLLSDAWTVADGGSDECWAVVGPAIDAGGDARAAIVRFLLGRHDRARYSHLRTAHPFLQAQPQGPSAQTAATALQHVSFSTRPTSGGSSSGGFVDYSARYGAIRTEDKVTLYESLLESLGVFTGNVAAAKLVPDALAPAQDDAPGRFKWPSREAEREAVQRAREVDADVRRAARMLSLDGELLFRPVIALSNGQTRRARILGALLQGAQAIVLEEPYTGLDPPTRRAVSALLADLHAKRQPRVILVLREQDELPPFVTHVLRIDEEGRVTQGRAGEQRAASAGRQSAPGGYDVVRANAERGVGRGDERAPPVAELRGVTIAYKGKRVLSDVSLRLAPGSRTVLVGDNGSGKTTLLSLLLGDHPQSYALGADKLALFGAARRAPSNSTARLQSRVGHFSPELFNAFPRKALERGGLTVGEAIASGFDSIFSRRPYDGERAQRVHGLLAHFADLLKTRAESGPRSEPGADASSGAASSIEALAAQPFHALSAGSQAVVLFLRAVVHAPALLVLDEPFQGMDARQVARARAFLDAAQHARGGDQDQQEAEQVEDRFATGDTPERRAADAQARRQMAVVVVSHYEDEWPGSCGRLVRLKEGVVIEEI